MLDLKKYLVSQQEGVPSKTKPVEISLVCPQCGKGNQHFSFNTLKNKGACFSCTYAVHSAADLVSKLEGVTRDRARHFLITGTFDGARSASVLKILDVAEASSKVEEIEHHVNSELPDEFEPVFDGKNIVMPKVLKERSYSAETLKKLNVGFCRDGFYGGRLIFPINCRGMKSFFARKIFDWMEPKYKNPPGSKHSELLYNYDALIHGANPVYVVEGCTDVCRLIDHGYWAVATSGHKISSDQIDLLVAKQPIEVVCVFDGDSVSQNQKAFRKLSYRLNVSFAFLPEKGVEKGKIIYHDPDSCPLELFKQSVDMRVGISRLDNIKRIINAL